MKKTFRYRVYPTRAQKAQLERVLGECRWVYNKTLGTRKVAYELRKENLGTYDTVKLLPGWKLNERPELKTVHSQVLQNVVMRVGDAYEGFFRRVKDGEKPGYPRFKGQDRYHSLTFPQYGSGITLDGEKLRVSGIGNFGLKLHRSIEGIIKTVTFKKTSTNKWFVYFSVDNCPLKLLPESNEVVGIDLGVKTFATLTNGETIENPKFFTEDEERLAKAQRKLDKQKRGTKKRRRAKYRVALVHEKIANRRTNFVHQESRRLVNRFGSLMVEDLEVKQMLKSNYRNLNKSITDAAWSQFLQVLSYKAEEAGRKVIKVNPRNTSKKCSGCGVIVEGLKLSDRTYRCPVCGLTLDRDSNAARNILAIGNTMLGAGFPVKTTVEVKLLEATTL